MNTLLAACLAPALWACALPCWAGRPLASDDAATADPRSCQLETWVTRAEGQKALTLAPACGIVSGVELGADYTQPHPRDGAPSSGGLALKFAPPSWAYTTGAGELAFGLKLSAGYERAPGSSWQHTGAGLLGLATWTPHADWAVHANLGAAQDRLSDTTARLINVALTWAPIEQALLFAETQTNNRREVFGNAIHSAGARWWLLKDRLGLDLTAHRSSGASTTWTVGLGWYGLGF